MSGLLGLVVLVLDIIAIVDVVKSTMVTGKKVLWIILVLILPVIGMILYFLLGKKK
ncbi:MAG: PLD nuclease N-terminal domain-containing protein [Candidatus Omnitrophota bacterium]